MIIVTNIYIYADREIEIVQHLGEYILQYQESLLFITNTLSELDWQVTMKNKKSLFTYILINNQYICTHYFYYFIFINSILSFSLTALQQNYVKPQITENNDLIIDKGRHPLYELTDTFIANDTYLVGGMGTGTRSSSPSSITTNSSSAISTSSNLFNQLNSILLLTGANYSGKSVYLKQVILLHPKPQK